MGILPDRGTPSEPGEITPRGRGVFWLHGLGVRHTTIALVAFAFELCERNPKSIKRWLRHVSPTRRRTSTTRPDPAPSGSGSPGESHPRAPTERNVTVSRHSALLIGSIRTRASTPSA